MSNIKIPLKIMVVGNRGIGKSYLLIRITTGQLPEDEIPIIFDNFFVSDYNLSIDGKEVNVSMGWWDADAEGSRLRPLSYPQTSIFLLIFSLVDRSSLKDLERIFIPEITHHCPGTDAILVGTKSDLIGSRYNCDKLTFGFVRHLEFYREFDIADDIVGIILQYVFDRDLVDIEEIDHLIKEYDVIKEYVETSAVNGHNLDDKGLASCIAYTYFEKHSNRSDGCRCDVL